MHFMFTVLLLLAPQRAATFEEATATATANDIPILIYAHGSDWCSIGETLMEEVWDTESNIIGVVFVSIDVLENPTDESNAANKGFDTNKIRTYPSILALTPSGELMGRRAGETLPLDANGMRDSLRSFSAEVLKRHTLMNMADEAKFSGDVNKEVSAIHAMIEQDLDVPEGALERLQEIDPSDASGIRRRTAFQPFYSFVAKATKDGQEGHGDEAILRLQAMLEEGVYTKQQQAWIHNAMGSCYRYWEGHDDESQFHFEQSASLAPESIAGRAGYRLVHQLFTDPSTELGWMPRHLKTEEEIWELQTLPSELARGTWHVTFEYTRGRHGIEIVSVELFDEGKRVDVDVHDGFAGSQHRDNVYTLELSHAIENPTIIVKAKGAGGTQSYGSISLSTPKN